ncbi:MAG: alpha/beta hydrolase [Saprospiraceae bacterium]|nr:alpha/beta hydrolase [Saprospiraceae bacterium]MDW8228206.1 alpha/beta hydrolase [Saprospiraceae bacterium]
MEKRFLRLKTGEVFYRHFGRSTGQAPVVLLHPSPLSSVFLERLGHFLSDALEVYAPDLPGYGLSAPLAQVLPRQMSDYVPFLLNFLKKKRLKHVRLYGTATGCQLAIAFALAFPEKVERLVGENACHFEETERAELFRTYFPDLRPQADGSHLLRAWEMCYKTCIGFPWTQVPANAPLPAGIPLAQVQAMAVDTLLAGEHYDAAYRAAFEHERAEYVQSLRVPATFILWQQSILWPYMERLASFPMPPNVRFLRCEGDLSKRYELIKTALLSPQPSGA